VFSATLLLSASAPAGAQLVRGTVTDRVTAAPLEGVLVTLERLRPEEDPEAIRTVLTNSRGQYVLRRTSEGRFRLVVKRIAMRPFLSAPFEPAPGQDHTVNVEVDLHSTVLDTVAVRDLTPCAMRREQAMRLAALWDDARAALTATSVSWRDSLVRARFVRFIRELDPHSLLVVSESLQVFDRFDAAGEPFFRSISADSLSELGYWRKFEGDTSIFHGPDAEALLSESFVRDHCFEVVWGRGERGGMTGLRFRPTPRRSLPSQPPDIAGRKPRGCGFMWSPGLAEPLRNRPGQRARRRRGRSSPSCSRGNPLELADAT
jgi:hypothetical protein